MGPAKLLVLSSLGLALSRKNPCRALRNGVCMPQVALGTGYHGALPVPEAIEHAHNATMKWLSQGGEHVDTAHWYTDEPGVGSGWKASGLDRKDIFLTTKMPSALGREAVLEYFANSTRDLQTDYIDLYLLHTPSMPQGNGQQTPTQCGVNVSWASCRVETLSLIHI